MSRINFYPVSLKITTDVDGLGLVSLKVPGTFNGVTDLSAGRFLKYLDVWTVSGTDGDYITNLRIDDTDGMIPIALRGNFSFYPTVAYFNDVDIEEDSSTIKGLCLPPGLQIRLDKLDDRELFNFVPAGMYLKCEFKTQNATKQKQIVRFNVGWGKRI